MAAIVKLYDIHTYVTFFEIRELCSINAKYGIVTVGSKIIRALEIIRVKKLMPNAVLWNKFLSSHDLYAYIVYNKYKMINWQIKEKSQVLSKVLE